VYYHILLENNSKDSSAIDRLFIHAVNREQI
jgi:hypothetical protein